MNHRALYVFVFLVALLGTGLALNSLQANDTLTVRKHRAKKRTRKAKNKRAKNKISKRVRTKAPGRWMEVGSAADGPLDDNAMLDAIGYVDGSVPLSPHTGVLRYDPTRAQPGVNFYTSGKGGALLMDMKGELLHRWQNPDGAEFSSKTTSYWRRALLLDNGDVIAIFEGKGLIRIDKNSQLLWASPIRAHHDLQLGADGKLWLLTREATRRPDLSKRAIVQDFIVAVDPATGTVIEQHSVLSAIERSRFAEDLQWRRSSGDLLHTNSLQLLDGAVARLQPAFQRGRVLVSSRLLNALMVIDLASDEVVWVHRGSYKKQHDPRVLGNGHLLVFDNSGLAGPHSRVLEYDLSDMSVVWAFRGNSEVPFHTPTCGAAARLPNHNTLLTESDAGRAIEVTPAGEVVWEFRNPQRAGSEQQYIAALFEMLRVPSKEVDSWLER